MGACLLPSTAVLRASSPPPVLIGYGWLGAAGKCLSNSPQGLLAPCAPITWSWVWPVTPPRGPGACSYPHVLVGELLHLLLVQAGQEELVLQLLCLLES